MIGENSQNLPLVSVVIPTYNRPVELLRSINSVLAQTYKNIEILVIDDGSEEDIAKVCNSLADNRIRFFRNDIHTNANVARNRGIREAKGKYIAMLDSDDEYMPFHIEQRVRKISELKCDGIFGSAFIDNGIERTLKLSRPINDGEKMVNYLLSDGFAPTPSHFYSAEAVKMVLWDESLLRHQDFDFSVRFAKKFSFVSDLEPSIVINWDFSQRSNLSECHYNSMQSFIQSCINDIDRDLLVKYYLDNYNKAKIHNVTIFMSFYRKELVKFTRSLSFNDFNRVNGYKRGIMRFVVFIKFIMYNLLMK